jgi:uncharacterized protein YndB with AHSA1/START domain
MTGQSDRTLSVTSYIAAPPDKVWHALTQRQEAWFCPRPWTVEIVEQDWRPGGRAAMIMRGPNGEAMPNEGVYLEVVPGRRYVVTDAFTTGWVPAGPFMVGIWEIAPEGEGTRYTGSARHWTDEACEQHRAMGFEAGWAVCAQQLKALCEAE